MVITKKREAKLRLQYRKQAVMEKRRKLSKEYTAQERKVEKLSKELDRARERCLELEAKLYDLDEEVMDILEQLDGGGR